MGPMEAREKRKLESRLERRKLDFMVDFGLEGF